MQLTGETIDKYKSEAPHLLEFVTTGEAEHVMKRDPATDRCVKFEAGWCGIHREYGEAFLGDACHFYPRITRALGETVVTTAALSCPEVARLMLCTEDGLEFAPREEVRVPYSLRNYLPVGLGDAEALSMHAAFMAIAGDHSVPPERALMRISAVAKGLEMQPVTSWPSAVPLYTTLADGRIAAPSAHSADLFNLVHALHGLVAASGRGRPVLTAIIDRMALALGMTFVAAGGIELAADSAQRAVQLMANSRAQREVVVPIMRRYLAAQISQALFPFSGFGGALSERFAIIGVRFATVKWALATLGLAPAPAEIMATIHVLSRFMDHLADPSLSLAIYRETGWLQEGRLRALVGDSPDE
jgi:hypothetical protein